MGMDIDMAYAQSFTVEEGELPSAGDQGLHRFPPDRRGVGGDGPLLRIQNAEREEWLGMFSDCDYGPSAVTRRVSALPDGHSFVVIAGGTGYVVDSRDPTRWSEVACFPITSYVLTPDIAVFGTHGWFCAHRSVEEVWRSRHLIADELEIVKVDDGLIVARGFDPTNSREPYPTFTVSLATGVSANAPGH